MQSNIDKTSVIVTIWISMGIISFFGLTLTNHQAGGELTWAFVLPLLIAFVGTFAVWWMDALVTRVLPDRQDSTQEKTKRHSSDRLALLLELMDDEERAVLQARLMDEVLSEARSTSDGELPYDAISLEALLEEKGPESALRG